MSVLLKKPIFEGISQKELAQQLEAKKKCENKLPTWFNTTKIYYPNKLNIEQTSSELTAQYKSTLINGKTLMDITGGFGVDSYYFSRRMEAVVHCEINPELSKIAAHNFWVLEQKNIDCFIEDGIEYLKLTNQKFDWIYIDPSRRDEKFGKVFLLKDCLPNLPKHLSMIFEKTKNVLIKTSPLLDISKGIKELNYVKEVHVIAIDNDVKELLFVLEFGFKGEITIKTINFVKGIENKFDFQLNEENHIICSFGQPERYLYEPNSAILKSGGFKSVGKVYGLKKLHLNSHLYTCKSLIAYPGRRFEILKTLAYNKKSIQSLSLKKANITVRNFPLSVAELRKKHQIKDGGDDYLFFTTIGKEKLTILKCKKINSDNPI
ncbi:hypothetical protein HME9304_02790 [Flagellimonas maritima]|uniref:Uncharacterized protein n=1 Tax=Flagellimonas maritima TaxID=1383885 RepID=A0A2Z4LVN1_9FLAO|nr:class I SAM-dependent methyltransferase [Allomuricauda aurantiaca]AWX45760.1 hypothetical protein HME9304_02790 [Allomuricauda aurantiaca]